MEGITRFAVLWVWLLFLRVLSRFAVWQRGPERCSFLLLSSTRLCGSDAVVTHQLWTLGGLHFLAIRNNVRVLAWTFIFTSPGFMPRSGGAGSHGNPMSHPLRNCRLFHCGCRPPHSPPHPLSVFLVAAGLVGTRGCEVV